MSIFPQLRRLKTYIVWLALAAGGLSEGRLALHELQGSVSCLCYPVKDPVQSGKEEAASSGLAKGFERDRACMNTSPFPNLVPFNGGGLILKYSLSPPKGPGGSGSQPTGHSPVCLKGGA